MFPAVGLELEAVGIADDGHLRLVALRLQDTADAGDGDAGDGSRNFGGGRGREEQLVIFATVEERGDLGAVVEHGGEGVERELREVEFGGDVGGGAEVGEVGGEAVAHVDAGGGEMTAQEGSADGEAGLGEEMRVVVRGSCGAEFAWRGGESSELGCCTAWSGGERGRKARSQ